MRESLEEWLDRLGLRMFRGMKGFSPSPKVHCGCDDSATVAVSSQQHHRNRKQTHIEHALQGGGGVLVERCEEHRRWRPDMVKSRFGCSYAADEADDAGARKVNKSRDTEATHERRLKQITCTPIRNSFTCRRVFAIRTWFFPERPFATECGRKDCLHVCMSWLGEQYLRWNDW